MPKISDSTLETGEALISACGKYRYLLRRKIALQEPSARSALFIMLNPSTADANIDDPTLKKCLKFAAREKCSRLTVVNLFAFRSPYPEDLFKEKDPVGPENDRILKSEIAQHDLIIAAWGDNAHGTPRAKQVAEMCRDLYCLKISVLGEPRHPLYLKPDLPLVKFAYIHSAPFKKAA